MPRERESAAVERMLALERLIHVAAERAIVHDDLRLLGIACEAWERAGYSGGHLADIVHSAGYTLGPEPARRSSYRWTMDESWGVVERCRRGKPRSKLRHEALAVLDVLDAMTPVDGWMLPSVWRIEEAERRSRAAAD